METFMIDAKLAKAVTTAFANGKKAEAKAIAEQNRSIQKVLDTFWVLPTPKGVMLSGNARTNPHRAAIAALFNGLVEQGYITPASGRQYQSAFWYAFERGTPFERGALNKSAPKKTRDARHGEVASKEAIVQAMASAMVMARTMGLDATASDLLDLILELAPDFKEPAE